jgi:adenosine kinase
MRVNLPPKVGETAIILDPPGIPQSTPGGCVNNIAVTAARLGVGAAPVILVGDDEDGQKMKQALENENVNTSCMHFVEGGKTPGTFLFIEPSGGHQTFYFPGCADENIIPQISEEILDDLEYGVITVGNPFHTRWFVNLLNNLNIPLVWSLRNDPHAFPNDLALELVKKCKMLVMNEYEARTLVSNLEIDHLESVFSLGVETIVLTMGAEGSKVIQKNAMEVIPSVTPKVILDTTGAGDAFLGGLLAGLCMDVHIYDAARIGATASSFVLEKWGCQTNLPDWMTLSKRFKENFGREPYIRKS